MFTIMALCGVVLTVVKANGWFVVPSYCIWFCYIMSVFAIVVYALGKGIGQALSDELMPYIRAYNRK